MVLEELAVLIPMPWEKEVAVEAVKAPEPEGQAVPVAPRVAAEAEVLQAPREESAGLAAGVKSGCGRCNAKSNL